MSPERQFPPEPAAVAETRSFVDAQLAHLPESTRSVAALLVSELATNAIRHAGSGFTVSIATTPAGVRIEVFDAAAVPLVARDPSPSEPSGRGLQIVNRLSQEWGTTTHPNGKSVWFVLRTGEQEARAEAASQMPHAEPARDRGESPLALVGRFGFLVRRFLVPPRPIGPA
jgi:anti-sigma regulatory factor (Ser/Thr protein kinase)